MTRHVLILLLLAAAASMATPATAAVAQRTFVASNGNDANACSLVAPCRSFAGAIARTNTGGEVIVLDSAGYGPVTIAQSVSIIAPAGIYAGITVTSGNGVTITTPGATVTLRGLSINGQGGNSGIYFLPGDSPPSALHVENCIVSGMPGAGIVAAFGVLFVSDTIVRENGGTGIFIGSRALATLDRVRSERNGFATQGYGIQVGGNAHVAIFDSVVADNGINTSVNGEAELYIANAATVSVSQSQIRSSSGLGNGIWAIAPNAGQAIDLTIDRSTIAAENGGGALLVSATAGAITFRVVGSTLTSTSSNAVVVATQSGGAGGGAAEGTIVSSAVSGGFPLTVAFPGARLHVARTAVAGMYQYNEAVSAQSGGVIDLSDSTVTGPAGLDTPGGGTIQTRGNNTITGTIYGHVVPISAH